MTSGPARIGHRTALEVRARRALGRAVSGLALAGLLLAMSSPAFAASTPSPVPASPSSTLGGPPPVMAYYYMWFNSSSWNHAKTDVPALGAYTSTNQAIIHQHVLWAKQAGINAFIVSWKSTPSLNQALAELVTECRDQGLKLVLLYEGLDVNRNPISMRTVESDLVSFMSQYGTDPVFDVFGKTAIIWSGTWRFSDSDVQTVRSAIGAPDSVLLLGSERGASTYTPRASLFDGDAYYWSSGDPLSTPGYTARLQQLGAAVHAGHGLWIAPAAAGFDALLNGGTTVVNRRDGATLKAAWTDAMGTNPDGLGVISWNEFTENSYIEPSRKYGLRYLQILAGLTGSPDAANIGLPSAAPVSPTPTSTAQPTLEPTMVPLGGAVGGRDRPAPPYETPALIVSAVALILLVVLGISLRRRASRSADGDSSDSGSEMGGRPGPIGRAP
jgi:hypothetical protein